MKLITDIVNNGHGDLKPKYLFVHSTANPGATAWNHRTLYSRGNWKYAVQYVSDWTGVVYHTVPDTRLAYAVGNGNKYGVNLEICEGKTAEQFRKTWNTAVDFCAFYLLKRGWGIDRMMSHDECTRKWGGSDHTDPIPYFKANGRTWKQFKDAVAAKMKSGVWVEYPKGWWFMQSNGKWPVKKWLRLDSWYYFDSEGYAVKNKWRKVNGCWYHFDADCRMQTGWKRIDRKWYYLNPKKDGTWPEGSARTGWLKYKEEWYYLNKAGQGTECAMRTGWLKEGEVWYYLQPDKEGIMARNQTLSIGGKSYTFDENGKMQ